MELQLVPPFTRLLDDAIGRTTRWCDARSIHAFGICWGLTLACAPALAGLGAGSWRGGVALAVTLVLYLRVFMRVKRWLIPGARRKLLIDFGLFVGPVFLGLCVCLGLDAASALRGLCLAIPFGIATLRMGCFFSGCCHGGSCRWGPRYPAQAHRVAPLPLLEAGIGAALLLAAGLGLLCGATSLALSVGLLGIYAGYRFCSEFFRARSGRFAVRRFAGLSITQWMCAALVASVVVGVGS
ncbi:MAG: prolipoprotein diacylglyceryl transferase family protein [Nannocystaceae bacterium]|nr:prolipoprotein diacylglyceryl transferase [bacterium]